MRSTSRIFSSARCNAGDGGSLGVDTMVGAAAVTDGAGVRSLDGRSSSASALRRMTIVGTPSSAAAAPSDGDSADGTVSVLPGPLPARASSSELRLNSCQIAHVGLAAAHPLTLIPHPAFPRCHLPRALVAKLPCRGHREKPRPFGAPVRAKKTRESRASTVNLPRWSIGVHRHFPGVLAGTAVAVTTGMATIAALEPDARSRERLTARGAEHLTDGELLAIVLGAGTRGASAIDVAAAVLRGVGGPAGLSRATRAELAAYAGIGTVRATLVIAALELGRRAAAGRPIRGQRLAGAS